MHTRCLLPEAAVHARRLPVAPSWWAPGVTTTMLHAVWVAVFLLMMLAQSYIKMLDIHRVSTHSIEATEGCLRAVLSTRCRVCAFLV